MNYTSNYLGNLKKRGLIDGIHDQDGVAIATINISENPSPIKRRCPKSIYRKSDSLLVEPDIQPLQGYKEVMDLGFRIISLPLRKGSHWFHGQHVEYKIIKSSRIPDNLKLTKIIPKEHEVLYDAANRLINLVGRNCRDIRGIIGETGWCGRKIIPRKFKKEKDEPLVRQIDELPIMIGVDGSIICIPHRAETNNIAVVGIKGSGKSLILHRIVDEVVSWWYPERVIIMNDIQEEYLCWSEELEDPLWKNKIFKIGECPFALPIIYVYPHTKSLDLDYAGMKDKKEFIQITVPFEEVMNNIKFYLNLKDSESYLFEMKDNLLSCQTSQEVADVIREKYPEKTMKGMVNKMIVQFNNIFQEGVLNLTNREYPSKLSFKNSAGNRITGNPLVVLAKSGVVPCFESADLYNKRYMEGVFAYHLNSIFKSKAKGGLLYNKSVYVVIDEITQICSDKKGGPIWESLCTMATRGRKHKLGLLYATQNYSKIPKKIQSNTDFVFAFRHSNADEVTELRKDFDLNAINKREILNLKSFEVIGMTNKYFVTYRRGIRREIKGPIKGKLIPPISKHLKVT